MRPTSVEDHAPSGFAATPSLRWGSHVGHLFGAADELRDVLVPYFKAGLENNERCLWVTGAPLRAAEARAALREVVPDLDRRERSGQIEIQDGDAFYDPGKSLPTNELIAGLLTREEEALSAGFAGLRTNGNCAWVDHSRWTEFQRYESLVQKNVRNRRMICMCSYKADRLRPAEMIGVIDRHDLVLRGHDNDGDKMGLRADAPVSAADIFQTLAVPALERWLELDQTILDALPLGFYCCDSDGQIVRANRKAVELWGRPARMLDSAYRFCGSFRIETLDGQLIPPDQSPMARGVLHGERFDGVEAIVENPDGKRWVARVHVAPLHDAAGHVVGAVNCFQEITREYEMRLALERRQHTFDLAMVASEMGTWRYTLADNVCLYDKNAQRLYGLTEARFLHDAAGVKDKFHPEDMERMWAQVAKALDPDGDGHYDVEYRVKQLDGSWRWLSAWGTVEFEGDGHERRPVAISGASRDLSGSKKAEELQRLLLNELNHRVKNTLATIQSITAHTLRGAPDLKTARLVLEQRIVLLARAHDLLTSRDWLGADIQDVVYRSMQPFAADQLDMSGPSLDVSPQHALAISLGLHELATNAAKYGALSVPDGRVTIRWSLEGQQLRLNWRESGGPPVAAPTRRGFGSRLIEDSLGRDLRGRSGLHYARDGVRWELLVPLS